MIIIKLLYLLFCVLIRFSCYTEFLRYVNYARQILGIIKPTVYDGTGCNKTNKTFYIVSVVDFELFRQN